MKSQMNPLTKLLLAAFLITSLIHVSAADPTSSNTPVAPQTPDSTSLPNWALGPFVRPANAQPLIQPDTNSVFDCPMRKKPMNWEATHTFNPAAVVKDGKIYLLYRAEDNSSAGGIGSYTSRLGLATSEDGIHFKKEPKPVFYPAEDDQKDYEWTGGCEDPRLTEGPDGTFYLTYTRYARGYKNGVKLGLATSKDLRNWTKHGSPFAGTKYENQGGFKGPEKSASIVNEVKDGHLVAAKINGKYWMYFGEQSVHLASSDDLIHWVPMENSEGKPLLVMQPRRGFVDSLLTEVGPNALLTPKGIILFYNTKNLDPKNGGDPNFVQGVYTGTEALFDAKDPSKLITRLSTPLIKPELSWEKSGQYKEGTTFIEGLALLQGKWFLYYGCADTFVGVATSDSALPGSGAGGQH